MKRLNPEKPFQARKKFERIQVYGFICVTQQGALIREFIRPHPEGEFPTVYVNAGNVPSKGIARRVRVTVEISEDPALPLIEPERKA